MSLAFKASVANALYRSTGGQFVTHVAALPGARRQYNTLDRIFADAGYRGHNTPPDDKFKVYTAGHKRRVTPEIKWQM